MHIHHAFKRGIPSVRGEVGIAITTFPNLLVNETFCVLGLEAHCWFLMFRYLAEYWNHLAIAYLGLMYQFLLLMLTTQYY